MKLLWVHLVFLGILLGCSASDKTTTPAAFDGHIVGNGGDPDESTFEQGRHQAIRVLQWIAAKEPRELTKLLSSDAGDIVALREATGDLIQSLKRSKHVWREPLPAGCPTDKCGCHLPSFPYEIFLSKTLCRNYSIRQAGEVCLHEATHSTFGSDEGSAVQYTVVAYRLWSRLGHPDSPHWRYVEVPGLAPSLDLGAWRADTTSLQWITAEKSFFIPSYLPGGIPPYEGTVHTLHLDSLEWTSKRVNTKVSTETRGELKPFIWIEDGAVAFSSSETGRDLEVGLTYQSSKDRWETIPKKGAPSLRSEPFRVSTADGLFIWGGKRNGKLVRDGALFSFASGWKPITSGGPEWADSNNTQVVAAGNEVIFLSGDAPFRGAAYHLKNQNWRELTLPPMPDSAPRRKMTLTWADDKLAVYGGCWPVDPLDAPTGCGYDYDFLTAVAFYEPALDRWTTYRPSRSYKMYGAMVPSVWALSLLTAYSDALFVFNIPKKQWELLAVPPRPYLAVQNIFYTGYEYIVQSKDAIQIYYP